VRDRHTAGDTTNEEFQMKNYLLSVITPSGVEPPPPEVLDPIMRNVEALREEMQNAGAWVFSGGLNHPSTATVVRVRDGDVLMTDGPFAEGKEYVGGFSIIRAANLDEALAWGRKAAEATTLPIEVRPFVGESED
jgi:hypothetical protein